MTSNAAFWISLFLSLTWGVGLVVSVREYRETLRARRAGERRSGDVVSSFRRVLVLWCLWLIVASVLFRSAFLALGFGETTSATILYFALIGSNVVGSLFFLVSLRYD